jgi:hypothetical protein
VSVPVDAASYFSLPISQLRGNVLDPFLKTGHGGHGSECVRRRCELLFLLPISQLRGNKIRERQSYQDMPRVRDSILALGCWI